MYDLSNIQIKRKTKIISNSNTRRKQQELRLIIELGTLRPSGLTINFSFIRLCLFAYSRASV